MTVFALTFRSFQGPRSRCLQTSETTHAPCTQLDRNFCLDFIDCALIFPLALLTFSIFVLSLAVLIVTAGAAAFVVWFQYKLSVVLFLLGQEDLQFVAPHHLEIVLYVELLLVSTVGDLCLIFVEM